MPPQVVHVKNATKVAAALASERCQQILEHLAKKDDATESQIAKDLKIPLSTVHYNMKILVDSQLVLADQYSYSKKGKEMTHYRRNENPIVIVQESHHIDLLKAVVPAAAIVSAVGIAWALLGRTTSLAQEAAPEMAMIAADADVAMKTMAFAAEAPVATADPVLLYFVGGVIATAILSVVLLFLLRWWDRQVPND